MLLAKLFLKTIFLKKKDVNSVEMNSEAKDWNVERLIINIQQVNVRRHPKLIECDYNQDLG